jgi:hypothetical protein
MNASIYQKILGKDFDRLGPNLQLGHRSFLVIAKGIIDVEWGKGFFVHLINRSNGLPPEGIGQALELEVIRRKDMETWNRKFTSNTFTTVQFEKKGLLVEKDGPVSIGFKLTVEQDSICYKQVYMKYMGFPIPGFFSLKSKAKATEEENGWRVEVEVRAPVVGLILKYKALVKLINFSE